MKILTLSLAAAIAVVSGIRAQQPQQSSAVPRQVRISNVFRPANGQASAPVESITVSIYRDEQGGAPLWSETQNVTVDAEGKYTAMVGATLPEGVPADLFSTGESRWMGVQFNRPGEMEQQRVQLVSVPYALKAADSETLGGKPASAYMLASAATGSDGSGAAPGSTGAGAKPKPEVKGTQAATSGAVGCIGVFTDSSNLGCSSMYESSNANIGIGTSSPHDTLEINGNLRITSLAGWGLWDGIPTLSTEAFFSGTDKDFRIKTTGGNVPGLTIKATNGRVGIGNASPSYALDVTGDVNLSGILRYQNSPVLRFQASTPNIGVGPLALQSNSSGSNNTAVGASALTLNTTGGNDTAIGSSALSSNISGNYNTALGANALFNNTGNNNTALGYAALINNNSGTNNIAIGYNAASSVSNTSTNSNNIHIGNVGSSGDSGVIRIGTAGTQSSFFAAGISSANVSGATVLVDTSTGQLGVASSSRRYKEDIHDMGDASRGLLKLRPVTFRYKKALADGSKPIQYGLIAEEVAEVYPDLVVRNSQGQIETVKYQVLAPMLLNEVERQQSEIDAQRGEIQMLRQQIADLRSAMISLAAGNQR